MSLLKCFQEWDEYIEFEKEHTEDSVKTREFFKEILDQYGSIIKDKKFKSVLEVGVGLSGGFEGLINAKTYTTIDPLFGKIKKKIEDTDIKEFSYDLIIISNTLSHCDDLQVTANKVTKVLKKGGYLFIFNYYNEDHRHPHVFTQKKEILTLFPNLKVQYIKENNGGKGRNPYVVIFFKK